MSNPFTGIITAEFKALHKYMIDALLEDTALTIPCKLIYGDTDITPCNNCIFDPIANRSANRYKDGGPNEFADGQICPHCGGVGFTSNEASETVYLIVIWDYKKFVNFNPLTKVDVGGVRAFDGYIQTMCSIELTSKLKQAKYLIANTDIQQYTLHKFIIDGEPTPLGLGADNYVVTTWKKSA